MYSPIHLRRFGEGIVETVQGFAGILWLAVAVLTGFIASRKGMSGLLYFVFGIAAGGALYFVVGPIGGVVGGFFALLFTIFQPSAA
jgi:hypothetical protein